MLEEMKGIVGNMVRENNYAEGKSRLAEYMRH